MSVVVTHNAVAGREQALAEVDEAGLIATEIDVPAVANTSHWHSFDALLFVMSGTLFFTDVVGGETHECTAGTRIQIPQGALHAERSPDGYSVVLGSSVPPAEFGDPVNRT